MNVYIWRDATTVSTSYHEGGGLVVIAASEEAARALANAEHGVVLDAAEMPDAVFPCNAEPQVFVFPNAGCC
jgi:hypothetical protein